MSVYNGDRYLRSALDSILQQSYGDYELIIIDDGSADSSRRIISQYAAQDQRICIINNRYNVGLTRSLNKGLEIARGEFIARQDADDISHSDRFIKQVEYLDAHPAVGLVGSNYFLIDRKGQRIGRSQLPGSDTCIRWNMLFNNQFCHSAVMFRRHLLALEKIPYDPLYPYCEDVDLWCRLMVHTKGENLPAPLVSLRKHDHNISERHHVRQQFFASQIACRQIQAFMRGASPSRACIDRLRQLHRRLRAPLGRRRLLDCAVFFDILKAFGKQPRLNAQELLYIKIIWITKILRATPCRLYPWLILRLGHKFNLSVKEGLALIR
jgi:glycosyltransferase involved in cell wall biosynthesis